ncbi:Protein ECERIFERUM 1 [Raphanus sativus]|uniref:Protein ECERIFERUM 2 n=1 Tax=Raphanus sativus TaxID=3726 RepID=A0A9W3D5L4_RAPSA|nr:protein ECERIFERUM 2 [Raphanus sativus]KAJ4913075.1 Protein ECERIFERUM 1 [Raphanus sativus]
MEASPVTDLKISSVVPASMTGENKPRHLTAMDLAVKLHYVRAVYFFKGARDFTIVDLKNITFPLLDLQCYDHVTGRIRNLDNDDPSAQAIPYIRCNDSGMRIVEAKVEGFTVQEWLDLDDRSIDHRFLVYDQVLGPDLFFSPLVYLQITQFKCGGLSIGLSWAHVLGDVVSASTFMKRMGQLMSNHGPSKPVYPKKPELAAHANGQDGDNGHAISIKKVESVGKYWLLSNNKCKIGRYNFNFSLEQIDRLMAKYDRSFSEISILYALIWRSMLNIRGENDTNVITICDRKTSSACWNDDLVISVVERKDEMTEVSELAGLVASKRREENGVIKGMIDKDRGSSDFITYGANLTFVNLDKCEELEIKGEKPDFVNYTIHGVGDKGVVLVFPKGDFARVVSVVMSEEELAKLKVEVKNMIM